MRFAATVRARSLRPHAVVTERLRDCAGVDRHPRTVGVRVSSVTGGGLARRVSPRALLRMIAAPSCRLLPRGASPQSSPLWGAIAADEIYEVDEQE